MVDGKIILGKAIESCNLYIEYVLILIIRMSPFIEQHFFFFLFFGRTAIEAYDDAHRYFKRGNPSCHNIASNISLFTCKIHFLNITIAFPGSIRTIDWGHHINNQTFFFFFFWLKIYTHSQTKI